MVKDFFNLKFTLKVNKLNFQIFSDIYLRTNKLKTMACIISTKCVVKTYIYYKIIKI